MELIARSLSEAVIGIQNILLVYQKTQTYKNSKIAINQIGTRSHKGQH